MVRYLRFGHVSAVVRLNQVSYILVHNATCKKGDEDPSTIPGHLNPPVPLRLAGEGLPAWWCYIFSDDEALGSMEA